MGGSRACLVSLCGRQPRGRHGKLGQVSPRYKSARCCSAHCYKKLVHFLQVREPWLLVSCCVIIGSFFPRCPTLMYSAILYWPCVHMTNVQCTMYNVQCKIGHVLALLAHASLIRAASVCVCVCFCVCVCVCGPEPEAPISPRTAGVMGMRYVCLLY